MAQSVGPVPNFVPGGWTVATLVVASSCYTMGTALPSPAALDFKLMPGGKRVATVSVSELPFGDELWPNRAVTKKEGTMELVPIPDALARERVIKDPSQYKDLVHDVHASDYEHARLKLVIDLCGPDQSEVRVVLVSRDGTLSHVLVVAREARTREHVEADARVHAHVGQTHVQVLPPQSMRTTGGAAKTVCNLGSMRSHGFYDNIANRAVEAHSPHCTLDPSIAGAWIRTDGALATSMIDKGVLWAQEPLSARRSPSALPRPC